MFESAVIPAVDPGSRLFNESYKPYNKLDSRFTVRFAKCPGMTRKGFTLIELLVVVLIIGILSAVALPQYTAAVDKARVAGYIFPKLKAACQAQQTYILANGSMTFDFTDLDVDISADCSVSGSYNNSLGCKSGRQSFNFYMVQGNGNIASHYKNVAFDVFPQGSGRLKPCQIYCRINGPETEARKFCARFGTLIAPGSSYYEVR